MCSVTYTHYVHVIVWFINEELAAFVFLYIHLIISEQLFLIMMHLEDEIKCNDVKIQSFFLSTLAMKCNFKCLQPIEEDVIVLPIESAALRVPSFISIW